jgi:hypothetical protein
VSMSMVMSTALEFFGRRALPTFSSCRISRQSRAEYFVSSGEIPLTIFMTGEPLSSQSLELTFLSPEYCRNCSLQSFSLRHKYLVTHGNSQNFHHLSERLLQQRTERWIIFLGWICAELTSLRGTKLFSWPPHIILVNSFNTK